jgi:DNA-directed RNA polymerase specialized sigma24 family protein
MFKCCICGKQLTQASAFVCGACILRYELALREESWPAWAQFELAREKNRRRFSPSYGVSGSDLSYAPYTRRQENRSYRRVNRVRKTRSTSRKRVGAENLFYSDDDEGHATPDEVYEQMLGTLPSALQERLGRGLDLRVVLRDAIAALPLISQRAIQAYAVGFTIAEIAEAENVQESTMTWLVDTARSRLRDILTEKLDADDGTRYRPR